MSLRFTIRAKILCIAFAINALCTGIYTANTYIGERAAFIDGVDKNLRSAARALPLMLPKDFHDQIKGPDSISKERHREVLLMLSDYVDSVQLTYLYSYMQFDGKFRVISTSDTRDAIKAGTEASFFEEYEDPPAKLIEAWNTDTVQFDEYTDEWGHFRSIFIPHRTKAGARFVVGADVSILSIKSQLRNRLSGCLLLGALIFLVVWLVSYEILTRILSSVGDLTSYTQGLVKADFRFTDEQQKALSKMAAGHRDEVGDLARAFRDMAAKLLEYIEDLKETTAAKERIESELKIAHDIQMSFLKKVFPPFPQRKDFDLYASLEPAKEVGGDLYDFFMLDDERLFFYVGDVSDKGVPAALFMAMTMMLMKRSAQTKGMTLSEILKQVNADLLEENENLLFVTLFCAVLNVRTGEMTYSNAGHNPPIIVRAGGMPEWLKLPSGIVLGVMPDAQYETATTRIARGDLVLTYTDGVTEAMNVERKLFSDEKLLALAAKFKGISAGDSVKQVIAAVKEHAVNAPQSDDITVLAVKLS